LFDNEKSFSQVSGSSQLEGNELLTDRLLTVNNQKVINKEVLNSNNYEKLITILSRNVNNLRQFLKLLTEKSEVNNLIQESRVWN